MRALALGILTGASVCVAVCAALAEPVTTRIETRPFYGATVTLEEGVRVFRPLPRHDRVIINPGGQTPLSLGYYKSRNYSYNQFTDTGPARGEYGPAYNGDSAMCCRTVIAGMATATGLGSPLDAETWAGETAPVPLSSRNSLQANIRDPAPHGRANLVILAVGSRVMPKACFQHGARGRHDSNAAPPPHLSAPAKRLADPPPPRGLGPPKPLDMIVRDAPLPSHARIRRHALRRLAGAGVGHIRAGPPHRGDPQVLAAKPSRCAAPAAPTPACMRWVRSRTSILRARGRRKRCARPSIST